MAGESGGGLAAEHSSRGAAFGDYDNDGDIDVLVVNMNEPPSLLRNDTTGGGHWITMKLIGAVTAGPEGTTNRDAIGARVRLSAGGRTQVGEVRSGGSYLSHNDFAHALRPRRRRPRGACGDSLAERAHGNADGPCRRSVLRRARGREGVQQQTVVRGFSPAVTRQA